MSPLSALVCGGCGFMFTVPADELADVLAHGTCACCDAPATRWQCERCGYANPLPVPDPQPPV